MIFSIGAARDNEYSLMDDYAAGPLRAGLIRAQLASLCLNPNRHEDATAAYEAADLLKDLCMVAAHDARGHRPISNHGLVR